MYEQSLLIAVLAPIVQETAAWEFSLQRISVDYIAIKDFLRPSQLLGTLDSMLLFQQNPTSYIVVTAQGKISQNASENTMTKFWEQYRLHVVQPRLA